MVSKFLDRHPQLEIQDLYKWLYFGEFGYEDQNSFLKARKAIPKLQQMLDEIDNEKEMESQIDLVWEPMGCSHRFISVHITPYFNRFCPLVRLVNIMERSPAFRGSRMQFKLDWSLVKEYALSMYPQWTKDDFYQFEDRIGFHQLPSLDFSELYLTQHPYKYRIVSQKLFFEYFPEFMDDAMLTPQRKFTPSIG